MKPDSVLVEVESVALDAELAGHNQAWRVLVDGRVFGRRNALDAVRPSGEPVVWYDKPYPAAPSHTLEPERLSALREYLEGFSVWPAHTVRDAAQTEGAGWDRLRVQLPQGSIEVAFHWAYVSQMRKLIGPILSQIRKPRETRD